MIVWYEQPERGETKLNEYSYLPTEFGLRIHLGVMVVCRKKMNRWLWKITVGNKNLKGTCR
jgi:hypothetical protein